MYSFSEPPYFLLIAGLLTSLACGVSFAAMIKQSEQKWMRERANPARMQQLSEGGIFRNMNKVQLSLPFIGTCIGAAIFLASALDVFGVATWLSYLIAVPIAAAVGFLIWDQIGIVIGRRMLRSFFNQESGEIFRGI